MNTAKNLYKIFVIELNFYIINKNFEIYLYCKPLQTIKFIGENTLKI